MTRPMADGRDDRDDETREVEGERAGRRLLEDPGDGRWIPWNEHEGILEWGPAASERRPRTD